MPEVLVPKSDEEIVHQTQHFETVLEDEAGGCLYLRGEKDKLVVGRIIPKEYAGMFTEVAEAAFQMGVRAMSKSITKDLHKRLNTSLNKMCGSQTYPRPTLRKKKE